MQVKIFAFAALLLPGLMQAQMLTVTDRASGLPLEHAVVRSQHPKASVLTDAEGRADISKMKGAGAIRIELIGYRPLQLSYDRLKLENYAVGLEQSPFRMDEVTVSAMRWKQAQHDVPARAVSVRSEDVLLLNPQTSADLLNSSGEVYVQKSQLAGGSPMIRGFATNRVLLVVDGVRMNTAIFRSGNVQNVISIDPLAVERTDVLFGPGAVVYGSDAIGGVMSFHTLTPRPASGGRDGFSGTAFVRTSSANAEKTGHVDLNIGLRSWGFATSASWSEFGDLRMGSNGPDEYLRPKYVDRINGIDSIVANPDPEEQIRSGYRQLNLMQKARFNPNDEWDAVYGFQYSRTSDYPRYDRLLRPRGGSLRSAEWYYGPQEWMMNALTVSHSPDGFWYDDAAATLSYQFFEESRHDRDFRKPTKYHRTEQVRAVSAGLDFTKRPADEHRIAFGVEAVYNKVSSKGEDENIATGDIQPGPSRYPDGAEWASLAAYANYSWALRQNLSLQAGIRYSQVSLEAEFDTTFYDFPFTGATLNNGSFNGSLGAVWNPVDALQINAALSTGFRAPNVDDVGKVFDSTPGSVVVPNPDLKPEYAYNAELGASMVFGTALKLDATLFAVLLKDALVRRNYTLNGRDSILYDGELSRVQAVQNAAEAEAYGVQARMELRLPAGFGLSSHFTWMHGEEELDDGSTGALRHAPPWFGTTRLTWSGAGLETDLYAEYNGAVSSEDLAPGLEGRDYLYALDENGRPWSPGWVTLNLKARYRLTDYLDVGAGVENIADRRYRPYASGITAAGRNFVGSLRVRF